MAARSYNLGHNSVLIAEVTTLRNGILLAKEKGFHIISIEGDNLTVITILHGHYLCPWKMHMIIDDIRSILQDFTCNSIHHIYREGKQAADYVASMGHGFRTHQDINPYMNAKFSHLLSHDKLGQGLVRRRA